VNAKTKILDLLAAEDKTLADLFSKKRSHALRAASFRDAKAAINGDSSPQGQKAIKFFESQIAREQAKEKEMELKISDARTRLTALREASSIFSESEPTVTKPVVAIKSAAAAPPGMVAHKDLRPASELYAVREILRKSGKPMLLDDIVAELGHPGEKAKRSSLRGTLMGYAKIGHVFTLESSTPKIFGLNEFKK
jgi:hypothetical protein